MRFSIFTSILAAGSFVGGGLAAPTPPANGVSKSLSPGAALGIVKLLTQEVTGFATAVNATLAGVTSSSSAADKEAAAQKVGAQFQKMTVAISQGTGNITQQASGKNFSGQSVNAPSADSDVSVADLAAALEALLVVIANVVNFAVSVLGLAPLLSFLTPLIGALSGLLVTLEALVGQLLAVLSSLLGSILGSVLGSLSGIIGG